jgi:hypothetical protein
MAKNRWIVAVVGADQAKANTAAATVDTEGGSQAFTTGIDLTSRPDNYTGRYDFYWCSWVLTDADAQALQNALTAAGVRFRAFNTSAVDPTQGTQPETVLTDRGARRRKVRG